jgi:hypothetical protein
VARQRRKHFKVESLPREVVEAVNEKLVQGYTYQQITDWLGRMGHEVGKSSVARYGKDFLARLERLKVVRDQAKAIVESNADAPGTQLAEAANDLALSMVMETLMSLDDLQGEKVTELLKVLPRLADAATRREALKLQFNRGVEAAMKRIKESIRKEVGSNPELERQLLDLVSQAAEEAKRAG